MQVLAEEPWSWMLFGHGEDRFLVVACGSIDLFVVNLQLTPAQAAAAGTRGPAYLSGLARDVAQQPMKYMDRHLADFQTLPGVKQAAATWRTARAAAVDGGMP